MIDLQNGTRPQGATHLRLNETNGVKWHKLSGQRVEIWREGAWQFSPLAPKSLANKKRFKLL